LGAAFYVIGKHYLHKWPTVRNGRKKVEEILKGESCCFCLVSFYNLEITDQHSQYYWDPYSIVDPDEETEPDMVLFNDAMEAVDTYEMQLLVLSKNGNPFVECNEVEDVGKIPEAYHSYFMYRDTLEAELEAETKIVSRKIANSTGS